MSGLGHLSSLWTAVQPTRKQSTTTTTTISEPPTTQSTLAEIPKKTSTTAEPIEIKSTTAELTTKKTLPVTTDHTTINKINIETTSHDCPCPNSTTTATRGFD